MASCPPEYRVDVVESGERARDDRVRCVIDEHLMFDTEGVENYCLARVDATVYDACLVGAAVQFCDHTTRRPPTGWSRDIALRVPVHDQGRWQSADVSGALHNTLEFLTGDRWRIDFVQRVNAFAPTRQRPFEFPCSCVVMPFSDGLDSYVASALLERKHGDALIRVRLGSKPLPGRWTRNSPASAFASVPWRVRYNNGSSAETSARSRGFRFALLSGIAAFLCKSRRVAMPESGQGALGPSLVPVGQAYPDFRNHPRFADKMGTFVSALFEHEVCYEHPRLWRTKGETLTEFLESRPDDADWMSTRSCWQGARQVSVSGSRRQCGVCAACLLRRMSVHAAGRRESPQTYVWEDLSAARFEDGAAPTFARREPKGALHEYAIAGVLHLDHLARLLESPTSAGTLNREAFLLIQSLELGEQEARANLENMLHRHEQEWRDFVDSLGSGSFVAQWIARGN